jgi:uncharacterized damage-inducible protein DinB
MILSAFFSHWNQIHADTLAVIDKFSQDELTYTAYEGGMSVGRIALHIADAEEGWFRLVATNGRAAWPSDYTLANYNQTMAYLDTLTIADLDTVIDSAWGQFSLRFIIWHVIEHEIHHRGELSLILGILGRSGLDV